MPTALLDQFIDQLAEAVAEKLQTNKAEEAKPKEQPQFMNKGQVASYLNTSRTTLDDWIAHKGFPNSKIGGRYIYNREDVDRWVATHTK